MKMMRILSVIVSVFLMVTACVNDVFDSQSGGGEDITDNNTFAFSTIRTANLVVDYSACNPVGAVFFRVYCQNPFVGSGEDTTLDENVKSVFESYTDVNGIFNETIELPAYAKNLYIVTGNFFISEKVMTAPISAGVVTAKASANEQNTAAARRAPRRAGTQTTSMATLYQLSNLVDYKTGDDTGVTVCKPWYTPLGTWDSESGRPNYLLDKNDAENAHLIFTEDEIAGLQQTIADALSDNQPCRDEFRKQDDLTLEEESEVALTMIGGNTCWNSSLGYYYYTEGNKPTSLMDVNVIMLFPNTQDGQWNPSWNYSGPKNYYGNIGIDRGDVVKLMYYPNIANNGDTSGATSKFPKGTKIGVILKPNGWGMQKTNTETGKIYYNSYHGELRNSPLARQYNVWAASTNGLSYTPSEEDCASQSAYDSGSMKLANTNKDSRCAKFAYNDGNGNEYAIISFEDACNDLDFDDLILALKPVSVFANLPTVSDKTTSTYGVYAFEDLWPEKGDYDMNDAIVDFRHDRTFSKFGSQYKITKETFNLTTYLNYVTKTSGLALTLETKTTPSKIVMKEIAPGAEEPVETTFTYESKGKVYLLTDDIKKHENTTYILELNYNNGISNEKTASVKPFIYRAEDNDKRWEVHLPFEAPTAKMNMDYFRTGDDKSIPDEKIYYVRKGNYPFAFYLSGVTVESFKNTLLAKDNERKRIDLIYPDFLTWSTSSGTQRADWYLLPALTE